MYDIETEWRICKMHLRLKGLFPRQLHIQVGFIVSLLLILTIGLYAWHIAQRQSRYVRDTMQEEAIVLAKNVAVLTADFILVGDYLSIENLLIQTAKFPNIVSAAVCDDSGRVVSRVVRQNDASPAVSYSVVRLDVPKGAQPLLEHQEKVIVAWHPVSKGALLGWVKVEYGLNAVIDMERRVWLQSLFAGLLVITVSVALILYFMQRRIRVIRAITAFAQRLDRQIGEQMQMDGGSMELDNLIKALNQTSLRLMEQGRALMESEKKYRALFEESKDVIFICTADGRIIDVNQAGVTLFGFSSKEELLQAYISKDIYRNMQDREILLDAINRQGFVKDHPMKLIRKDGEVVDVLITIAAVRDGEGNVIAYRGSMRDVTVQHRLEEQLRHAQKMEAVGQLTGGIAHDFNNILTAIIGYGHLLQMRLDPNDPRRSYADHILASAERAAGLTQGLLAFSRKQVLNPRPVDLNDIINRVKKLLSKIIGEDIDLETRLYEGRLTVMADSGQIEQVLMNFATNARDAMPEGGRLMIETSRFNIDDGFRRVHGYGEPGEYALVSITDTGIGMDENTTKRIFEPFFTTKEVGKGTGLGLSIVYGIVKQHGGYVNVYSEPGKGTTFKMYLPLVAEFVEVKHPPEPEPHAGGCETVLVAEDDPDVRSLTCGILDAFGYRVISAENGDDAIQKFRDNKDAIDLVLLDVVMPKKNGKEVFGEMQKMREGIRVLYMSGYPASVMEQQGIVEKGTPLIVKPVSPKDLLKKVRCVLDA